MLVLYKRLQIIIIFNDNVIRCCFFLCFMKNFRDKTKALKMVALQRLSQKGFCSLAHIGENVQLFCVGKKKIY